jgi:hypothetical protein
MTDDVMVVQGRSALAGPRCIDLRRETAELLGRGEALGMVGLRERWRMPIGPVEASLEIGGWIVLEWGDGVEVDEVAGPGERMETLAANLSLRLPPADPANLLDLAALPMLRLRRPQRLDALDAAHAALLAATQVESPARVNCP